ncbi:transcription termination/antitermination protein NusG [Candidatus Uhrbacteria bacterium]|nr:MAG: transcription termination/antitermination protein NusG [Candidatus Uhrbacteria bacterium]
MAIRSTFKSLRNKKIKKNTRMPKQTAEYGRRWYAIHTYSGYEENVADSLNQRIEALNMKDHIFNVLVPKEKKIKIKNGKRRVVEEKIYPGYVLVDMNVTDDSWYVVRNTPNVTGFIGTGTTPSPLSQSEVDNILKRAGSTQSEPEITIDLQVGMAVKIGDGPFKGFEGKVNEIDGARGKVKVLVSMFGRETPLELDFTQVKKI